MLAAVDVTHDVLLPVLVPVAVAVLVGLPVLIWRSFKIWNYLQSQMSPNGKARPASTEGLPLRDALDVNTTSTQRLESRTAFVDMRIAELQHDLKAANDRFAAHLEWADKEGGRLDELEQRQHDILSWGLRNMTELRDKLDELGRTDTRPPQLEPGEPD